jgi:hypothetical protein
MQHIPDGGARDLWLFRQADQGFDLSSDACFARHMLHDDDGNYHAIAV